ncbi:MAG: hypothetical protein HXY42_12180 [Chloroflexi bacterium]|nr:hypothetical protein [Chloroflexota bacterium]
MKKLKTLTYLLLLAVLILPTNSVYAQGPGPGNGRVIFGSNITVTSDEPFEGDLVLFGGNVTVEKGAELNGDLVVIGGNIIGEGFFNGEVVIVGGQIKLEESATVSGNVVLVGGQIQRADGAKIKGEVFNNVAPQIDIPSGRVPPVVPESPDVPGVTFPDMANMRFNPLLEFARIFGTSLLMAFLGMLAVLFFQQRLDRVSQAMVTQPVMTVGVGMLSIVALVVSAVTLILLPVALLGLIPLGFAWLFGVIAVGREVGERLSQALHREWAPVLTTGLGTFILVFVVDSVQALDNIFWLVGCFTWVLPVFIGLLAIGAVVMTRFGAQTVQGPMRSVYNPPADTGPDA